MHTRQKKIEDVLSNDPKLNELIDRVGSFKIRLIENPYEALVDGVITQQISDAAGMSIAKKFVNIFENKFPLPEDVLSIEDDILMSCGITKSKLSCIKEISRLVDSGEINFQKFTKMNDDDVVSELIKIKGIGRWTAEMFLIFGLGRLDVLPLGDLGLKRGIQKMYSMSEIPNDEKVIQIFQKWIPYRTVATWYIWKGIKNFKYV